MLLINNIILYYIIPNQYKEICESRINELNIS